MTHHSTQKIKIIVPEGAKHLCSTDEITTTVTQIQNIMFDVFSAAVQEV